MNFLFDLARGKAFITLSVICQIFCGCIVYIDTPAWRFENTSASFIQNKTISDLVFTVLYARKDLIDLKVSIQCLLDVVLLVLVVLRLFPSVRKTQFADPKLWRRKPMR